MMIDDQNPNASSSENAPTANASSEASTSAAPETKPDPNQIPTKVLIVDDELDVEVLMKQRFRKQLRENKFIFFFAHNGIEALDQLTKDPDIRLVISDINMPEMDGLTLLKNINEKHPMVIPIIVSAYGDLGNIRKAMNYGAYDFVTKPIDFDDLNVTVEKTLHYIQNLLSAQKTKYHLDGILSELNVASQIQQSILPKNFIQTDTINLFAQMTAAKHIGGDFYDFFWLDKEETRLALVIADVSGKGVPAALFMTVSRTLIRAHANNYPDSPGKCLTQVNHVLSQDNANMMFVTTFYGQLDIKTGKLTYCNAGHNLPHIIRQGGAVETLLKQHGMALGVMEDNVYGQDEIILNPKDMLFLYTDGVTEAEESSGKFYGDAHLIEQLDKNRDLSPTEIINTIRSDITTFAAGFPQSDDITVMAVKRL